MFRSNIFLLKSTCRYFLFFAGFFLIYWPFSFLDLLPVPSKVDVKTLLSYKTLSIGFPVP